MTQPADVEPPFGAEADIWEDDGHRDVYWLTGVVPSCGDALRCPIVTAVCRQDRSGQLSRAGVLVEHDGNQLLTAEHARELALLLVRAANEADVWSGVDPQESRNGASVLAAAIFGNGR